MPEKLKGGQTPKDEPNTIFANIYGIHGTGKSTLALTFPPPLYVVNIDRKMKTLLEAMPSHYEIVYERLKLDVDAVTRAMASQYLGAYDAMVAMALKGGKGTFIFDGFDVFWDIVKLAKLPEGDDIAPREWSVANEYMNNNMRRLEASPLHVAITAMAKKRWTGAKTESDTMEAEGFKHRKRWVTHELYMFTPEQRQYPLEVPAQGATGQTHMTYIDTCKLKEELIGSVLPNMTFKTLYTLNFGELPPDADKLWIPNGKPKTEEAK